MKNCINQEFRYVIKSKVFVLLLAALVSSSVAIIYYNCKCVIDSNKSYKKMVDFYERNDLDAESDMDSSYGVSNTGEYSEDGSEYVQVDNPIKYYYETCKKQLYVVSNSYVIDQYLEYGLMIFPIVFSMFGIVMATYDTKYKTIKTKTVRFGKDNVFISKQIVMGSITIFLIIFTSAINLIIGYIVRKMMLKNLEIKDIADVSSYGGHSLFVKVFVAIIISFIFLQIGFLLARFIESTLICSVILFVYVLFGTNMFAYGLKNVILSLASKIYEFRGSYSIDNALEISDCKMVAMILVYGVTMMMISWFINKKKSAYV